MNIKTFGAVDERSLKQLERCMAAGDADYGVLCADHHPGYSQPIGGAIAYEGYISPSGCGFDIGCGNKAAQTNMTRADLDALGGIDTIMREVTRRISFGIGVPAAERSDHQVLDKIRTADFTPQRKLLDIAESQLGTVGSGNHFVNLMEDESGRVWVGVHFGSRGFGHKTASGFLALAQGLPFGAKAEEGGMDAPPVLFASDSELGQSYISAMELAGEYAYAGRDIVTDKVLDIIGAEANHEVHNHHNFCVAGTEKVQTPHGYKRMRDLRRGDTVFAFDEHDGLVQTRVTATWLSGRKPIYEISTPNRAIRCSGEHPILTIEIRSGVHPARPWHERRRATFKWKAAREVRVGDIVVCAQAPVDNGRRIGADRARLVGAFLGDGWIRSNPTRQGYTLGLAIGRADEPHTVRYLTLCSRLLPANWRNNARGHFGLSASSKKAYREVALLGLGAKAPRKKMPAYAFSLPRVERLALLGGYFDADGSVASPKSGHHGRGTIASVSRELVEGLRELGVRSGMRVAPVRSQARRTNFGTVVVHRCFVAASAMDELELWHEMKAGNVRRTAGRSQALGPVALAYLDLPANVFAQRVRSVRVGAAEDVYDATVEHSSHSFVCEGIVVHNCWREEHFGRTYWVIRKGCTPARPGQEGFVGGSMGDESVILEGVASSDNEQALFSTVHGAGRVMSRTQAAGRVRRRKRWACRNRDCDRVFDSQRPCPDHPGAGVMKVWVEEQLKPGVVDWPAVQARLRAQGIVLLGGGADEAPEVYKRLPEVLAAHGDTVRVKHTLRPLGVAMASRDVFDPYKD